MRNNVANRSRAAVAVAGTRGKGGRSNSAHYWTDRGKFDRDEMRSMSTVARPGKTKAKRGGR